MEPHSEDSSYSTLTPREAPASVPALAFGAEGVGPGERYGHAAAVVDGGMFVFGGCDASGHFLDDVARMDLATVGRPREERKGEAKRERKERRKKRKKGEKKEDKEEEEEKQKEKGPRHVLTASGTLGTCWQRE